MKVNLYSLPSPGSYYVDLFLEKENHRDITTYLYCSRWESIMIINSKAGYPTQDKRYILYKPW